MNPPGGVIRRATESDLPTVRRLADRIWKACYPGMISGAQIDHMLGWMYSEAQLRQDVARGVRLELVEVDGVPVGYLATEADGPSGILHLHKLYLVPERHGRGEGRWMLDHVLDLARAGGFREIRLRVNKANARALRAYERAGFRKLEAVTVDIGAGFVMDDFVLGRDVEPAGQKVK